MQQIKVIIGLGNPGRQYTNQRHNIGFRVLDALAHKYHGAWQERENMMYSTITIHDRALLLIKPQTFMNSSGTVIPYLKKQGMAAENILVVHDELEVPFGTLKHKMGGSHKGHNGLRSLIEALGTADFGRLRFGISRPENRDEVPQYVLQDFRDMSLVETNIDKAVTLIEELVTD